MNALKLGINDFSYADLYDANRLNDLLGRFDHHLEQHDNKLSAQYAAYRQSQGDGMSPEAISEVLVQTAPIVGEFIAQLFNVEKEREAQITAIQDEINTVFALKNQIINAANKKFRREKTDDWNIATIKQQVSLFTDLLFPVNATKADPEYKLAWSATTLNRLEKHFERLAAGEQSPEQGTIDEILAQWRQKLSQDSNAKPLFAAVLAEQDSQIFVQSLLDIFQRWIFIAPKDPELQKTISQWLAFKSASRTDFNNLVPTNSHAAAGYDVLTGPEESRRRRDGFALTDQRYDQRHILYEINQCKYCHDHDTDSCSKGMRLKKETGFRSNPLDIPLTGCPLEEKISEMQLVKRQGDNIGALALIIIDNPMCPGTGHRICNDCMKGCIYQKTEPVDIPQAETSVLTDVLFMPYGFEIYSFLTRWNPLNVKRPHALPYNGLNVLVAGMGPAGYTLAHYLLNEGFGVAGIDALKIEPLPERYVGSAEKLPEPIRDFNDLYEALDERIMLGFGGVAEYGITVRWDKNFLKVIYLTLARRQAFKCYGGVRFGGTLTIEDAWSMGFDHIAMASGAGKPTVIGIKNNLIRGIRKASDFLMGLQLTGAAKASSLANMQVRLPAGVIGGGLTGTDTATELLAYYPVQVEKILHRYETLVSIYGEEDIRSRYDDEERVILEEFLAHGRAIVGERERAKQHNEKPDFQPLLNAWGGVTMFYRKGLRDAPAYRQNHEEIIKAFEEGIAWVEGLSPIEAIQDENGHLKAMRFDKLQQTEGRWSSTNEEIEIPLKNLYVAAGTSPNTIYQDEHPDSFVMDGKFFQRHEPEWTDGTQPKLTATDDDWNPKIGKPAPFTSYQENGKYISFFGDNHPVYAGNVVKAMASAKDGYPYISKLFEEQLSQLDPSTQVQRDRQLLALQKNMDDRLIAKIVQINRLTPTIIEIIVRAPMQAEKFYPGQFYRVQSFEANAEIVQGTTLSTEGIALTGAWVDKDKGLISLIALEMGTSSRQCALWETGDELVVMGVTGAPTEIPTNQTIALIGGGLGNAVLFSIGKAMRAAGNKVIYFAGYKNNQDQFKVEDIEAASDVIVWSVDPGNNVHAFPTTRPQDFSFVGNILKAMEAYGKGALGETTLKLHDVEHLIVIGSHRMMAAVKEARGSMLKPYLKTHEAVASINSPMQCMMKGICAQCMCRHTDPKTGEEYFVYSCNNQDQDLDRVDFDHLDARLRQNSVQEKLSNKWLDYLLDTRNIN